MASFLESSDAKGKKIFFDPQGSKIEVLLPEIKNAQHIILAIGPEGDLTSEEKDLIKRSGFIFATLTATILRACQAALLSAGIIRSFIR